MKKIIIILLFLVCIFQYGTKADDNVVGDFEIEGIVLKESLLNYFKNEDIEIKKKNGFIYPNKDFYSATFINSKFEQYDRVQFHLKANDKKYIIYSISGQIMYENNISKCYTDMDAILSEIKKVFESPKVFDYGISDHEIDKTGNSKVKTFFVDLKTEKSVEKAVLIECYDWSKEHEKKGRRDLLSISIDSDEFEYWINNKAFN